MTDEVYEKVNKFEAMRNPDAPAGLAEATGSAARQLCPHHPNVNYKLAWGCPDCLVELRIALRESVKLQAHYATLLNQWDGGERMIFADSAAWIARLRETKTLPPNAELTHSRERKET